MASINGQTYDWDSTTVFFGDHGILFDIKEVKWTEERPAGPVYGKGSKPTGERKGNYKLEVTAKIGAREYARLQRELTARQRTIYNQPRFALHLAYANGDQPTTSETLPDLRITGISSGAAQNDEEVVYELTIISSGVRKHNGVPVL